MKNGRNSYNNNGNNNNYNYNYYDDKDDCESVASERRTSRSACINTFDCNLNGSLKSRKTMSKLKCETCN